MAGTAATLGTATAATGIPIGKNQLAGSETTYENLILNVTTYVLKFAAKFQQECCLTGAAFRRACEKKSVN